MKEGEACEVGRDGSCWDFLVSVLQTEHPAGLSDSLRLTSVAEEYYRKAHSAGRGNTGRGNR